MSEISDAIQAKCLAFGELTGCKKLVQSRDGGITQTTNQMMPAIAMGMQVYSQVPQVRRMGNGNGDYPIFAVRRL